MTSLFLDTGYIIALELADDQHHQEALAHWKNLSLSLPPLVTTSYIFDEVVTFFNSRNHHGKAVEIGRRLLHSPSVQMIQVDRAMFYEAWEFFKKYQDKSYSLTDSVSFVVMQQLKIGTTLTFDRHFVQAGFNKLP